MTKIFIAAAFAAVLSCGAPVHTVRYVEPIGHGCSDGSDIVAFVDERPATRSFQDGLLYWCDERDDLPGYDEPLGR